jgi:hypothetical protein
VTGTLCPKCGGRTHRSRTRGFNEKLVKAVTSQKVYRCRECDWRGWLRNRDSSRRGHPLRTIIGVLVTLLITTLLALYVIEKLTLPPSNSGEQQAEPP